MVQNDMDPIHRHAQASPESLALWTSSRKWSYAELDSAVTATCHRLQRRNVHRETRVAVHLERSLELIVLLWALWRAGAVAVPLSTRLPDAEVGRQAERVGCAALISGQAGVREHVPGMTTKERLRPTLAAGNVDKTLAAPVTVIVAHDLEFYERLPELFPHADARSWFAGKPEAIQENAFRNGTLQGGYLILAARSLGLDCGPMSGFNNDKLDAEFFPEGRWRSNFLINLGHGDDSQLTPRDMRLPFDEACQLL